MSLPYHRAVAHFVFCALAAVLACLPALASERALDWLEHRRWLAADGGPAQVGAIAGVAGGYLWIGSNESLLRFDGLRFTRQQADARGAPAIVASLLADDGALWVGLRSGGLRTMRDGVLSAPDARPGAPAGTVSGLARERGGALWAAADDGLARHADGRWQRFGRAAGFDSDAARAVFVDRAGGVWAAGEHRLFYLASGAPRFVDTDVAIERAGAIAQAPDGALWLAERHGGKLHRVLHEGRRIVSTSTVLEAPVNALLVGRDGGLWLGSAGRGLRHLADPTSLAALAGASAFTARQGLSSDFVWDLHQDGEGNLWVGTNAGLDRFRLRVPTPAPQLAGVLNVALAAGADGSLWAGPGNGAALRLHGNKVTPAGMPGPVNSALRDTDGVVWMAGPDGIWRARGARLEHVAALPAGAGAETPVRAMARDAAGALWVSINRVGLFRREGDQWRAVPAVSGQASQRMPVSALAAPDGALWFGYRDGLLVARRGAQVRRWSAAEGLDIGHVTALAHHAGRTWVGGQFGLGQVVDGRWRRLRLPDGGLFENIYAIVPVPASDALWLHTRSGIFQLALADLERAAADPGHRIGYRSYDAGGGLANDPRQLLALPTAVRGRDGRLWFSTGAGVAWIDPARLPAELPGPTVVIESVSVDGAGVARGEPLVLGPDAQRIGIDYTALSLAAPERISFRYRLEGYDDGWIDAGRARQATYTGLAPGDYRFRVMALNKDGVPSPREAVFGFHVAQAFYRHPLFLAAAGLLLAGALWLIYRATARRAAERVRDRLQERHRERERIARELHDTLLQGVHGLVLRFQAAADLLPHEAPVRARLEQALVRADQVLIEGRDRVRELRGGPADTRELHEALAAAGDELATEWDCRFVFTLIGATRALQAALLDEVYRVGLEAIRNAFAHAQASQVRVDIVYRRAAFVMTIADDGRGIDPAWLGGQGRPDHWGLCGMRERAERIGASLEIRRGAGREGAAGTQVVLALPARMAYRRRRFWQR